MKIPFWRPDKLFKFRRTFTAEFVSLMSIGLVLSIVFSVFYTNNIIQNTTENRIKTNETLLFNIVTTTDYLFEENLHLSLTKLCDSDSIIAAAYSTKSDINVTNLNRVKVDMATVISSTSLVSSAFLYLPKIDSVVTSSYSINTLADCPYMQLINYYETNMLNTARFTVDKEANALFRFDNQYVLARDMYVLGGNKLATIFFVINLDELHKHLKSSLSSDVELWIYDAFKMPVFSSAAAYPKEITTDKIGQIERSGNNFMRQNDALFLINNTSITQWKFLLFVDESSLKPKQTDIFTALFPIILGILFLTAIISVFLSFYLYKPFQKLIDNIDSKQLTPNNAPQTRNEFDYLNQTFAEIADRQTELSSMMRTVSSDVLSRLFLDMITGSQISFDHVKGFLNNIKSPFKPNAIYVSSVIQAPEPMSQKQIGLVLADLHEQMDRFNSKHRTISHALMVSQQIIAIILSFDIDVSIVEGKKTLLSLEPSVLSIFERHGIRVHFKSGHMYHSILDVGFSYNEALKSLPQQEAAQDAREGEATTPGEPALSIDIKARAQQVISLVADGDIPGAQILSARVIDEIFDAVPDLDQQIGSCRSFVDVMTDMIAKFDNVNLSTLTDEFNLLSPDAALLQNGLQAASQVKAQCTVLINELSKVLKKQKNPYIIAAQQHIRENYNDLNLSLSTVAESIDITPNYLSKLFKDNLGTLFNDYINQFRINSSIELMKDTTLSIADVALQSGFSSIHNYIRVFKRYMNQSPGKYREMGSGKEF